MAAQILISSIPQDGSTVVYLVDQTFADVDVLQANEGVVPICLTEDCCVVYREHDQGGIKYCIDPQTMVTKNPHPA